METNKVAHFVVKATNNSRVPYRVVGLDKFDQEVVDLGVFKTNPEAQLVCNLHEFKLCEQIISTMDPDLRNSQMRLLNQWRESARF